MIAESWVLEILKHDDGLKMSLYGRADAASTLRHFSQSRPSFDEIHRVCEEVTLLLNKCGKQGLLAHDSFKELLKCGKLLWDILLTPQVKTKLKSSRIPDLVLSIDEELVDIPWELLYDGGSFLCLNYNLGRLVRTKREMAPVEYRGYSSVLKMLILANPTDDLRGAYLEGINIRNQFDRKRENVRIDFKSTSIDRLYVKKNLCDYDVVHFAGHCEFDREDPFETGWVLSDGKFTTQDILNMGTDSTLPSLIFSNACHSADAGAQLVEDDYQEKSFSLASAFLFSGVRHYIGSIRRVEDASSLGFAKELYAQLISGKSVGESMRLARLKLIKEQGVNALPWASYLLYGDPNFVLFKGKAKMPAARKVKSIFKNKKLVSWGAGSFAAICLSVFLYMWLPSVNPSAYFMYSKARSSFLTGANDQALITAKAIIAKNPNFLDAYPLIGDTYQRLGDKENALKYYFDYMRASEKRKDTLSLTAAYVGIGWVYYLQGDYDKAFKFYDRALNLSRKNGDKLNEADVLGKLALWQMDKNDYGLALEYLTKSSEINRAHQNVWRHKYNLACDYFNLGYLFTEKEDYQTAREFYDKSFKLFVSLKLRYELSDYYFNIGEIYSFQKEYQKALDCYKKGLDIDESLGHKPNIAGRKRSTA
ncbi:MAG: CHAT domain-containing protein [Candidatus Omnitrophica bacterium]|nr:CHAT domain-containing protein [Candidatus Omnitrophota bacterium]